MVTRFAVERRAAPGSAVAGIAFSLALAVAGGVLRFVNTEPALRTMELAGDVAFAVVLAAPGLLAILALRDRPSLLVAAGALELVFAFLLLISLVGLAFVVPAVLFFVAAGQARRGAGWPRAVAAVLVTIVLGTVAFFALFAREDPVCWARDATTGATVRLEADPFIEGAPISVTAPPGVSESGCSSGMVSTAEALASMALVGVMLGAAWRISKPPAAPDEAVATTS